MYESVRGVFAGIVKRGANGNAVKKRNSAAEGLSHQRLRVTGIVRIVSYKMTRSEK